VDEQKLDGGLSPRSVEIIHATLHKALMQAVGWMLIPRDVAEAATPPRPTRWEIKPLSQEQARTLLKAARGDGLHALYVLAVTTGMRNGELLVLQWKDVDLEDRTLLVRRTVFNGVVSPVASFRVSRRPAFFSAEHAAIYEMLDAVPHGMEVGGGGNSLCP